MTIQRRLKNLEKKSTKALYPDGCTRAEIVVEIPANSDKDTFYIRLISKGKSKVI